MKPTLIEKTTTHRATFKRVHKWNQKLSCHICKPHRGCNRKWFISRSWKDQTKKVKQWM